MERNKYSSNGPPRENKNGKTKLTRTRLIVLTIFGPSSGKSEKEKKTNRRDVKTIANLFLGKTKMRVR